MKNKLVGVFCCIFLGSFIVFSALMASFPAQEKLRVGTFDSRAIAIANSRAFGQHVASLKEKYNKAKEEGNETLMKELEATGVSSQQLMHLQGVGKASVADILEKVKEDLPKIAEEAGVDLIVSQWEVWYRNPAVEIVDVTSHLAQLFDPDEITLKMIEEIRKKDPRPLVEILKHELEQRKD